MVAAACPKCTIYLIEANTSSASDLQTAEIEAVNTRCTHREQRLERQQGAGLNHSAFDAPGVVYLAGSPSSGYPNTAEPGAFASVVSVGGTVLSKSGSTYSEGVWPRVGAGCASAPQTFVAARSRLHDAHGQRYIGGRVGRRRVRLIRLWRLGDHGGRHASTALNAGVFGLAGNASSQNAAENFWTMSKKKRSKELHYISTGNDGSCGGEYLCTAGTKQFGTYSGPAGWGTPNGIKAY